MSPSRSLAAPWRATLLAVLFVAAAVPVARAADPEDSERPYVVVLKNSKANAREVARDHGRRFGVKVRTIYEDGLRGYAGVITDREAKKLAREPGVAIGPDTEVRASEAVGSPEDLTTSPYYPALPPGWGWGLDRIDQHPSLAAYPEKNKYHYTETGDGVIAYVIDSGVNTNHQEFDRSRATAGFDAFRASGTAQFGQDCNGHGTHVAGILGGRTFGVAKDVSIVSVRVLDCNGSGSVSNVVAGINHVTGRKNAAKSTPMVANMSLGGSANSALDQAVFNSIAAGVTYSIAAGNGNIFGTGQDACRVSPARVKAALTVGATDTTDKRTTWSNWGSCVDVYAPGNNIVSSYGATGSTSTSWKPLSGTSMAAPAVGGVAALLLDIDGDASPAQVSQTIFSLGTEKVVTGTNTGGARLLYSPYTPDDLFNATKKLGEPASSPPPPPPPSCFLICL